MFARVGSHRGSVQCRSAASPQVLFLLEWSLAYRCAWHLRLAEGWVLFHLLAAGCALLFFSKRCTWPLAVASELLSFPHSVCGHSCSFLRASPLSTCCLWMRRCCFGVRVPALPCGHHSRGEVLFRGASGQHSARCHWSRAPWFSLPMAYLGRPSQSPLGCFDRSAELVESSLPGRGRTWRHSREQKWLAHSANASRDSSRGSHR